MDGNHLQLTRRRMLGALVGTLAILAGPARQVVAKDATKRPDYGSKGQFKLECELLGGTFSEDGLGNTECHFPDGSWIECDASGNDRWYTPAGRPAPPSNPWDSVVVTVSDAITEAGEDDSSDPIAPDSGDVAKGTRKRKGKKRGRRGKGRRG